MPELTIEQLTEIVTATTAAQSMLLASVLRPFIEKDVINESDLLKSLAATHQAALQRRTPETPALTGLIALLRRDLGFDEATHRDDA